jgi:hypothetical protein
MTLSFELEIIKFKNICKKIGHADSVVFIKYVSKNMLTLNLI